MMGIDVKNTHIGKMQYVGRTTLAAPGTTITVSGLDLDTDGKYFIEVVAENNTAGGSAFSLYYNADTTATNYYSTFIVRGGSLSSARANTARVGQAAASDSGIINGFVTLEPTSGAVYYEGSEVTGPSNALQGGTSTTMWSTSGTNVTGITLSASAELKAGARLTVWKLIT